MDNGEEFKGQDQQEGQDQNDEFNGYDQENLEMFQQQDQPFYAEDLRNQEPNSSNQRYFQNQGLAQAAQSQSLSRTQQHENVGRLLSIACGKNHSLNLTRDGDVFSMGQGEMCVSGHGGSRSAKKPQILKPLRDKRVTMIACGEQHSMVMTDKGYLYTWGRGFEGQLGLSETIEMAASPSFVKFFHSKDRILNVSYIAAGSFYSLAIVDNGTMYAWGEARMGQLGVGKQQVVRLPTRVSFPPDENGQAIRAKSCSAGFGHTAALSDKGELYTWGFSIYGQTGHGDMKTKWYPERVCLDDQGQELPLFNKVACSKFATYALDKMGRPYSWGQGYIGHGGKTTVTAPKMIVQPTTKQGAGTDQRIFTDIFASSDGCLFYAPIRVYEIYPKCGPSKGNTVIQIVGTGFQDSDKLKVRFTYGDLSREVPCHYDTENQVLVCRTPLFEEFDGEAHPSLKMPCDCFISVTMDGINYSECEEPFKIYSNDINLTSVFPKCSSVKGGTTVTFSTNIDEETAAFLTELKIGLRPKRSSRNSRMSGNPNEISQSQVPLHRPSQKSLDAAGANSVEQNQISMYGGEENMQSQASHGAHNSGSKGVDRSQSMDESDAWVTAEGHFENGKIIAKIPKLDTFDPDQLQYSIDIALNGQQFTGRPVNFRYYDVNIQHIVPDTGPSTGGTNIMIAGRGLYDAGTKKVRFSTTDGENMREVQADWDKQYKAWRVTVPPHIWLFGEEAAREREEEALEEQKVGSDGEPIEDAKKQKLVSEQINISLTLNNQEWIEALPFKYHDLSLTRLAYVHNYREDLTEEEERTAAWLAEEPEEALPEEISEEEIKKRDEEKKKKATEETEEVATMAKRKGAKMYLYGENIIKSQALQILFTFDSGAKSVMVTPIYKNPNMLAFAVPDMGEEVPVGQHPLNVEVTANGQNFTANGLTFQYNSVDPSLSEEDLKRMDEDEAKNAKKGGAKKK